MSSTPFGFHYPVLDRLRLDGRLTCSSSDPPHPRCPLMLYAILTRLGLWYPAPCHFLFGHFIILLSSDSHPVSPSCSNTFCALLRLILCSWPLEVLLSSQWKEKLVWGRKWCSLKKKKNVCCFNVLTFKKYIYFGYKSFVEYMYCKHFLSVC